jgi:[ribosomal protein S5]-alanine N-acetyltransferase
VIPAHTVTIEPLRATNFETVARWLATPALNRWLTADWREREANATTLAIATRNRHNRLFLVRYYGQSCGLVALSDLDLTDRTAMLWYLLGDAQLAGKGITTEAIRALLNVAFRDLELSSVYAWAMAQNEPSLRVLRKIGFREAGRLRHSATLDGQQTDRIYFDLLASEWADDASAHPHTDRVSAANAAAV